MRPTGSTQADNTASRYCDASGKLQAIPSVALACFVLLSRRRGQYAAMARPRCRSAGRDAPPARSGGGGTDAAGAALAEDLARALDTLRVPAEDQGELLGILGQLPSLGVGQ